VSDPAVFGTCTTTLGNFTGVGFDEVNALTVSLGNGLLASSTRDAIVLDRAVNTMAVGDELIRFRTATLSTPGVYVLTGLLRGQAGTEWAVATHVASERCALLTAAGLRRVPQQAAENGQLRFLRAGTLGSTVGATSTNFTNTNRGLQPFAPLDLRLNVENGFMLTWKRRTRYATKIGGVLGTLVPLGEAAESYDVELVNGASVVVQSQNVSTAVAFIGGSTRSIILGRPTVGLSLSGGAYFGVSVDGNTNATLRTFVSQTAAGTVTESSPLGATVVGLAYTATDAYTAAYYVTGGTPSFYAASYVQRFSLASAATAAATYTAPLNGDLVGVTHDGTNAWALEQFSLRLRRLNSSTLAVVNSYVFTGPLGGLKHSGGNVFFRDGTSVVAWNTTTNVETWRTAIPGTFSQLLDVAVSATLVFVAVDGAVHSFSQATGALVQTVSISALSVPGTTIALQTDGTNIFLQDSSARLDRFVALDGATGLVSYRFSGLGSNVLGLASGLIFVGGSSGGVGLTASWGVTPISSLAGLTARVYQLSATVGRGRAGTLAF